MASLSVDPVSGRLQPVTTRWVCLTGFMGSGKTTVGRTLAASLGWGFIDLDDEIVAVEKRPIAEIFRDSGEPYFRAVEAAALDRILTHGSSPAVIALGGGAFVQPGNRERLRQLGAVTIFLDAPCDALLQRCLAENAARPLLQNPEQFRRLYEQRYDVYMKAEFVVRVDGKAPAAIASEIAERLASRAAVPE